MIKSFKNKEAAKLFNREYAKNFAANLQRVAFRKLRMLHRAENINDLRVPPSNHLEILVAERKGQYSIRINKKWRICFYWSQNNAYEVEIVNYH